MKTLLLAFAFLMAASCAQAIDTSKLTIVNAAGTRHEFKIELALTPPQQERGLMNRTELADDHGMLFYFGSESERAFWMKNTLIPLDMIFIRKDGTIANIHENAKPHDLTSIPSNGPVIAGLEIQGGQAKKRGIKAGDMVHHAFFGNE